MARKTSDSDVTVIGDFRLIDTIAEGGYGRTYKGEHILTGEPVCIKDCSDLDPAMDAVLLEEAKAIWDLRHYAIPALRNIVKMPNGRLALVMSYIPGKTLEQIVEKIGRLKPVHVAWITERILNALKYMHFHGAVHGDVKPKNIIIQPEEHMVVLVDYGLSLVNANKGATSKGYTPYFAPPEALAGKKLLPESDLFGLGMTMVYALGGSYDAVKRLKVPEPTPAPLAEFLNRLIVRDVNERPRWENEKGGEDLLETFAQVRIDSFGSRRSNMEPLPEV